MNHIFSFLVPATHKAQPLQNMLQTIKGISTCGCSKVSNINRINIFDIKRFWRAQRDSNPRHPGIFLKTEAWRLILARLWAQIVIIIEFLNILKRYKYFHLRLSFMSKRQELISEIRSLNLPQIIENSLINDTMILVGESEKQQEVYVATKIKSRSNLTEKELFKLLENFHDHGMVEEWIGDDFLHIFFTYFDNEKNYHLVIKGDGTISIGRPSDIGYSGREFDPVEKYVSKQIENAAKSMGYKEPIINGWIYGERNFDYSHILKSRIESIKKYKDKYTPKKENPRLQKTLECY